MAERHNVAVAGRHNVAVAERHNVAVAVWLWLGDTMWGWISSHQETPGTLLSVLLLYYVSVQFYSAVLCTVVK